MVWLNAASGLSGASSGIGLCDSETVMPRCTSAAAARVFSGVIRFIVPSSSSAPQRPQLLISWNIASNSATLRGLRGSCVSTVTAAAKAAAATSATSLRIAVLDLRVICVLPDTGSW